LREITTAMKAVGGCDRMRTGHRQLDGTEFLRANNGNCKAANNRTNEVQAQRNKSAEPNVQHKTSDDEGEQRSQVDFKRLDKCNAPPPPVVVIEPPTRSVTTENSLTSGERSLCRAVDGFHNTVGRNKDCDDLEAPGPDVVERRRSSANETRDEKMATSRLANLGSQSMKKSVSFACSPTVVIVDNRQTDFSRRSATGRHAAVALSSRHRQTGSSDDADIGGSLLPRATSDGCGVNDVTKCDPSDRPARPRMLFHDEDIRRHPSNRHLLAATVERDLGEQRAIGLAIAATDRVAYVEQQLQKLLRKAERKTRNQRHRLYLVRLVIVCAAVYVMSWIPYAVRHDR
jgi:hypothetical protein